VRLDRVLRHEEALSDLSVRHSLGSHTRDAHLGSSEVAAALRGVATRTGAGGDELVVGTRSDRVGTAGTCQLERLAEWLTRIGAPAGAADRGAELEQRGRMLEPPRRLLELGNGLLEQLDPGLSRLDEAKRTQGGA